MFVAIAIMLVFILLIYLLPLVTKHIEKENKRVYKAYGQLPTTYRGGEVQY